MRLAAAALALAIGACGRSRPADDAGVEDARDSSDVFCEYLDPSGNLARCPADNGRTLCRRLNNCNDCVCGDDGILRCGEAVCP